MEAVGLDEIHRLNTDQIELARRREPRTDRRPDFGGQLFILVGAEPREAQSTGSA